MADNITAQEMRRRLIIFLRISTEVWTDIFTILPRSILVQIISPVCYRFKEICNKNVKNVHIIDYAHRFTNKLKWDDPEANQHLKHLTANKCHLADQFCLPCFYVCEKSSKVILRHSLDLLLECQITINPSHKWENEKLAFIKELLSILQPIKPITIRINQKEDLAPANTFWPLPIVQKCSRVMFIIWKELSNANANVIKTYMGIYEWLHHQQPSEMDYSGDGADQDQVRCMLFWSIAVYNDIDLLLDRCSQDIQQARESTDRRPYVLSFYFENMEWTGFDRFHRIENKSTGEVLVQILHKTDY